MGEILDLINKMSPYLLLGFLLAGVMHAFVPSTLYRRYLGVPLPLCSCGVIPTAMSLKKEGASKGATVSFLIATPQTGVDSIMATYSLMGLPFALLRPIAALVTSLFGGQMVNWLDKKDLPEAAESHAEASEPKKTLLQKTISVFRYAYVDMMQDIGRWLIIGLVVAGLITVFVPESFFALFADNSLLSMLLVLAFAIPMYLCATGSIPIAQVADCCGMSGGWFNISCSIILALLLLNAMIMRFRRKDECDCHDSECVSRSRTYRIEGLRCNHCKASAEKAVSALDGVEKVEIDLASGVAVVEGMVKDADVAKAVEALGFKIININK